MFLIESDGPLCLRHRECGRTIHSTLFPATSIDLQAAMRHIDAHVKQGCTPDAAGLPVGTVVGTADDAWLKIAPDRWSGAGYDRPVTDQVVQAALDGNLADVLRIGPTP